MKTLRVQPLTAAAMAPYGSVIAAARGGDAINGGSSRRHEAVAALDLQRDGGRAVLAVYDAQARAFPFEAQALERHRLSDQVFLPLGGVRRCVLLLAPAGLAALRADDCVALLSDGWQGVRIAAGTWHHGLLALDDGPWAVLERRGALADCDEVALDVPLALAP
ncbi:MAG: ureidoglycolate lyase [Rubrivivax sp.]